MHIVEHAELHVCTKYTILLETDLRRNTRIEDLSNTTSSEDIRMFKLSLKKAAPQKQQVRFPPQNTINVRVVVSKVGSYDEFSNNEKI